MSTIFNNIGDVVRSGRSLIQPDFAIDYHNNGLTHTSDDTTILHRDIAGNISIEPSSSNLLVIEPIINKVTTTSVLKVIDTSFQYYKFPVATVPNGLSIDLNIADSEEILYTELLLPIDVDSKNQIQDYDRISTSYSSGWFYNDSAVTEGYKTLPFTGGDQPRPNSYTITKEILDLLRSKNKTLKFSIQTQFNGRYDVRTSYRVRLNRINSKSYRDFKRVVLYSEGNVDLNLPTPLPNTANPYNFTPTNEYPYLYMEYYVDMNDIQVGDSYFIEAMSGGESWSLNSNGFWKVEAVDTPTSNAYYGYKSDAFKQAGVYYISSNTVLKDDADNDIGIKNVTSNQEFVYY